MRLEVCNLDKELASWALFLHWVIMLLLMLEQGLPETERELTSFRTPNPE